MTGRNGGTESTQNWGETGRIDTGGYTAARVRFASQGEQVGGNLFAPTTPGAKSAIVVLGPVGSVKGQSAMQSATRLARLGFATLIFDPRTMGKSAGVPRRNESGAGKVQDLVAALELLSTRAEVSADRLFIPGLCQGSNWAVEAALIAPAVRAVALVAGHYLTPEIRAMILAALSRPRRGLPRAALPLRNSTQRARWTTSRSSVTALQRPSRTP